MNMKLQNDGILKVVWRKSWDFKDNPGLEKGDHLVVGRASIEMTRENAWGK